MKLWARRGFEWAEEGLAGLWCPVLTGATGSTLLDCNPSTSNHGTLTNFSNLNSAWVGSQYGSVLNIQDSQWADCGLAPGLNFTGPFAVAAWVRNISGAFDFGIVSKMTNADSYKGWGLITTAGTNGYLRAYWNQGPRATSATIVTQVSAWQLLSMQWTGTSAQIYINGGLDASSAYSLAPDASASTLNIGRYVYPDRSMRGDLAEACVWNRSLTRSEHFELYRLGPGGAWQLAPPSRRYATILANAYTLIAASASYSIIGQPVGLLAGRLLTADAASYLLAGNATGLNAGRLLTADSAAYTLTGQDANLLASRLLSGDTATYNLIGNSANLLASRTLQANSAQYTVTGSDAALLAGRLLDCGSSAFLLSPNQAGLLAARKLTADQASILLTTQATNLYAGRKITADTAQFFLIASPVDLTFGGGGAAPYYYLFLLGGSR